MATYHQIFVLPEDSTEWKVTFDNIKTQNLWCYHVSGNTPHVTEIFEVRSVGGSSIEVHGIPAPGNDPPQLSVLEDRMGVPDRNPIFLPGIQPPNAHSTFLQENQMGTQRIALSFITNRSPTRVYLVPSSDDTSCIETLVTSVPQYYFELGRTIPEEELKEIEKEGAKKA